MKPKKRRRTSKRLRVAARREAPARVLVAEDDRELRWLIARALRKCGFTVVEAEDGSALLERAGESLAGSESLDGFDLIVSDIRMPGFSGLDVLAGLTHAGVRVPVLLITAFGDDATHEQARRLGAVAVVDKPFDTDHLCGIVVESLRAFRRSAQASSGPESDSGKGTPHATH